MTGRQRGRAHDPEDDRTALREVALGSVEALDALYTRHAGRSFGLACHLLEDTARAETVLVEVFRCVWATAGANADRSDVLGWILSLTHRLVVQELRHGRNGPTQDRTSALLQRWLGEPPTDSRSTRRSRALALSTLDRELAVPLVLAYFGGYTATDIAAVTREPVSTVSARTLAALRALPGKVAGAPPPSESTVAGAHPPHLGRVNR